MAKPHLTLTQLAQQAAAQIGFTLRRWWREKTDPQVLRVEVERRLVGAPPAIAVLAVTIPHPPTARRTSPAQAISASRPRSVTRTTQRTGTRRRTANAQKS
jgi:hypothetical protein